MKKPIKIALWGLGGLVALGVILLLALPLWLGPVVTTVANKVVPAYTGTDFKMESFSLNPYSGKLRIGSILMSNPKGFDEPAAFSVKSVSVDFDTCSFLTKKIHIADVTIDDPFVSYVFDDAGSNNFERIMASVQEKLGPATEEEKAEEKPEEEKESGEGKKLVIDRLAINGTWVKYRMIKLPIPIPTLTDIGGGEESQGASPEEVQETVWNAIKDKFSGVGGAIGNVTGLLGDGAADATKAATQAVGDGAKAAADTAKAAAAGATDAVKNVGSAVGDGAKAAAESATDALKKVGNLFGK